LIETLLAGEQRGFSGGKVFSVDWRLSGGCDLTVTFPPGSQEDSATELFGVISIANVVELSLTEFAAQVRTGAGARQSVEDNLSITKNAPLLWNYGSWSSIMATSSMPFPHQFFFGFHHLVSTQLGVDRDPSRYLNWRRDLNEWVSFVSGRAYLLLSAPDPIVAEATKLLDGQAVEYAVLPDPKPAVTTSEFQLISFGRSWLVGSAVSWTPL